MFKIVVVAIKKHQQIAQKKLIKWLKCTKGMRNCFDQHFSKKYGTASILPTVSNSTIHYSPNRRYNCKKLFKSLKLLLMKTDVSMTAR